MIKRLIFGMLLCIAMVTPAMADTTGIYAGGKFIYSYQTSWGGGLFSESYSQSTAGGGVFVGYDFYRQSDIPLRTEIEYAFRGNIYKDDSGAGYNSETFYNMQTLLVNFYYDFYNESSFTPYVGGGIGAGFMTGGYKVDSFIYSADGSMDDTVLAWNVGGGVGYAITDRITADLGYRYMSYSSSYNDSSDQDFETSTSGHEVSLGVRFNF